jgi:activator of HSP90 ATPase
MKTIKQTYKISASLQLVWQALVEPKHIQAWSGSPAQMEARVGATFKLWDGDIFGTNTVVEAPYKLIQEWWGNKKWKNPSIVIFSLKEIDGHTELKLVHEKVPAEEIQSFADGWQDFYLGPLKYYVEKISNKNQS